MKVSCLSAFSDKTHMPDEAAVAAVLGDMASVWDELCSHIQDTYPNVTTDWKHYGNAAGWTCKILSKKRNLIFAVPREGCFRVRFCFGEKACACVETDSEIPEESKETLRTATKYAEGRGIDIDVTHREQLDAIKRLLKIKYEN